MRKSFLIILLLVGVLLSAGAVIQGDLSVTPASFDVSVYLQGEQAYKIVSDADVQQNQSDFDTMTAAYFNNSLPSASGSSVTLSTYRESEIGYSLCVFNNTDCDLGLTVLCGGMKGQTNTTETLDYSLRVDMASGTDPEISSKTLVATLINIPESLFDNVHVIALPLYVSIDIDSLIAASQDTYTGTITIGLATT